MMSFHACASNCSDPSNHSIYLAGSNDGISWARIDAFTTVPGSVPDLIFYNNFLYIYHTGTNNYEKLNACFQNVDNGSVSLSSDEDSGGFVDPSMIISNNALMMFYLPGITGSDPAGCSTYPCTKEIHSALSVEGSATAFEQVAGNRSTITLSNGAYSDPEIVVKSNGSYHLYVSSGQSVYVYESSNIDSLFTAPASDPTTFVNGAGGVPSVIEVNNQFWVYVTTSSSGVEVIRRAVSSDGMTTLSNSDFSTVIDNSIATDFTVDTSVSSPSIIIWPEGEWSINNQ